MSRESIGLAREAQNLGDYVVTLPTGTTTLDPAKHANRLLQISTADAAYTINLPLARGLGDEYEFLSTVARTSGSIIINAPATPTSNKFVGTIFAHGSTNTCVAFSSTTNDIITLNNTTTGGFKAGDYIRLQDVATDTWRIVWGFITLSTAGGSTPFSG